MDHPSDTWLLQELSEIARDMWALHLIGTEPDVIILLKSFEPGMCNLNPSHCCCCCFKLLTPLFHPDCMSHCLNSVLFLCAIFSSSLCDWLWLARKWFIPSLFESIHCFSLICARICDQNHCFVSTALSSAILFFSLASLASSSNLDSSALEEIACNSAPLWAWAFAAERMECPSSLLCSREIAAADILPIPRACCCCCLHSAAEDEELEETAGDRPWNPVVG